MLLQSSREIQPAASFSVFVLFFPPLSSFSPSLLKNVWLHFMSVLCSAQFRIDTCREQRGDGEIAIGNKICWSSKGPTAFKCLFSTKRLKLLFAHTFSLSCCFYHFLTYIVFTSLSSFLFTLLFHHWLSISLLISLIRLTSIHISAFSLPALVPISSYLKS